MYGWQPIDTAPQNPRQDVILLNFHTGQIVVGSFCDYFKRWEDTIEGNIITATHWFPIPSLKDIVAS